VKKARIAVFASGSGSNAEKIFEYFKNHQSISVDLLLSNNPQAFALQRAEKYGVHTYVFSRDEFYQSEKVSEYLKHKGITHIVLAGFMWLVPSHLLAAYPQQIVNIHPALLPKYGGKGMYGMHVHKAVIAAGEKESGITIHMVNEKYDEGKVLFQARCEITADYTPEDLAEKIHILEHQHYPKVIEGFVMAGLNE
jgi:phosphoribosylglycinamide formyltransferase 1